MRGCSFVQQACSHTPACCKDIGAGQRELDAHEFPQQLIGMPLVSTYLHAVADYRLLLNETEDALQINELLRRCYRTSSDGWVTCSIVSVLLHSGRSSEALQLARDQHARSTNHNDSERHYSKLALGLALAAH